jgi:cytoskeletal protein CcmA (bactofilin family)
MSYSSNSLTLTQKTVIATLMLLTGAAGVQRFVRDVSQPTYDDKIVEWCTGSGTNLAEDRECKANINTAGDFTLSGSLVTQGQPNCEIFGSDADGRWVCTQFSSGSYTVLMGDDRWINTGGDTMTGALVVEGTLTASGSFVVDQNATIQGNAAIQGTIAVTGLSTFSSIKITGTASGSVIHAESLLTSSGTLAIEGASFLQGNVTITGNVDASGDVQAASLSGSALTLSGFSSGAVLCVKASGEIGYRTMTATGTLLPGCN